MTRIVHGDRIGATGQLRVGCSAVIFDQSGERILLTRRADNGQWCLPSGGMEPGESAEEACLREVWEETGLRVEIVRLIGVYTDPHRVIEYKDGKRFHLVAISFEARVVSGNLTLNEEVTEFGYFTPAEIQSLNLIELHHQRIQDSLKKQAQAFVR